MANTPLLAADFDLEAILAAIPARFDMRPVPPYPPVLEDLALVVDENIPAEQVSTLIQQAGGETVRAIRLFDVYRGEQVGAGKKSLAYSLTYQACPPPGAGDRGHIASISRAREITLSNDPQIAYRFQVANRPINSLRWQPAYSILLKMSEDNQGECNGQQDKTNRSHLRSKYSSLQDPAPRLTVVKQAGESGVYFPSMSPRRGCERIYPQRQPSTISAARS